MRDEHLNWSRQSGGGRRRERRLINPAVFRFHFNVLAGGSRLRVFIMRQVGGRRSIQQSFQLRAQCLPFEGASNANDGPPVVRIALLSRATSLRAESRACCGVVAAEGAPSRHQG
jgi:hypothetical protein